jgi:hypothetical protein
MTAPVYCETCEQMTHPTFPHSCFSAATLRAHKEAEQKVIAAAKALEPLVNDTGWSRGLGYDCTVTMSGRNGFDLHNALTALLAAVAALRAVEGDV